MLQLLPECTALPFIIQPLEDGGLQGKIKIYRLPCGWNARTQQTLLLRFYRQSCATELSFLPSSSSFFLFYFIILNILLRPHLLRCAFTITFQRHCFYVVSSCCSSVFFSYMQNDALDLNAFMKNILLLRARCWHNVAQHMLHTKKFN